MRGRGVKGVKEELGEREREKSDESKIGHRRKWNTATNSVCM